ncbi:MAG: hypothetical protein OEQ74_06550 [Gammaproteobacteria bacterium]|nr:hypothetical protein [Gammaproteobacteria bacterium]
MATLYDSDADHIPDRKVAVPGFGARGRTRALNLNDSGIDVRIGLRGGSRPLAPCERAGLKRLRRG